MPRAAIQLERAVPYQQDVDQVLTTLGADARNGLTEKEVRARLERYGKNELTAEKQVPWWKRFLSQFKNVLVILLLIATANVGTLLLLRAARRRRGASPRRRGAARGCASRSA